LLMGKGGEELHVTFRASAGGHWEIKGRVWLELEKKKSKRDVER